MKPKCRKGVTGRIAVLLCIFFLMPALHAAAKSPSGNESGNLTEQKALENADTDLADKKDDMAGQAPAEGLKQKLAEAGTPIEKKESKERGAISLAFFEAQKVASIALMRVGAVYTDLADESSEWRELKVKLSRGKGLPQLLLTLFIVAMIIAGGVIVERLVNRHTEDIRQSILSIASLGRFQKFGRFLTRILLDALSICAYVLTTFLLFVLIYQKGETGFIIASISIIGTYYMMVFVFAARVICSPASPSLRLLPIKDADAVFLYRWLVLITAVACFIAVVSSIFRDMGISQELFYLLYSTSGISVVVLLIIMILQSRERVTRAICEDTEDGTCEASPFLNKFSRRWHFFAILYVVGAGVYWNANMLLEGKGDLVHLLMSIFLIPIFIGIDQWGQKLLKIASGELPRTIDLSGEDEEETPEDDATTPTVDAEITEHETEDKTTDIKHYVPFIRRAFRFLLVTFLFFVLLRLWGIDLPIGRLLASHALGIIVTLLLGVITWELTKAWIDRRIQEEMPDMDEEAEEGGAGGSRIGTLLVLLRKFVLTVLFIIVSLIILSSLGVNIGPLIAGAGVVGLAIGFGAQTLVKDIIAGIFFLIDDAFRVGDYIETAGMKGTVDHISLRSLRLRHPRGMVHTIPFGGMGTVTNNSRDYIITKLTFRVRYDTDVDKVRKIVKRINTELQQDEVIAACLLGKIKSQGVRELDDSAMIMRVKYTAIPGKQFLVRKELLRLIQEKFHENNIEFAHRNVTVYLPEDETPKESADKETGEPALAKTSERKRREAAAAAAQAVIQAEEEAAAAAKTPK